MLAPQALRRTTLTIALTLSAVALPVALDGTASAATRTRVDVKTMGARGDGVHDDTVAIQRAIDAVARPGVVYLPGGTYRVTTALLVSGSDLTLRGAGRGVTVIKAAGAPTGGDADAIRVVNPAAGDARIAIMDLTIDHVARTAGNGISLQDCDRCRISRVNVLSPWGFGIVVGSTSAATGGEIIAPIVEDILVVGERNGNDSIGGGGIVGGLLQRITVIDPGGTGIDLTNTRDSVIRDVVVRNSRPPTVWNWGIASDFGWRNVTVRNADVSGMYYGYYVGSNVGRSASDVRFVDVRARAIERNAMWLDGTRGYDLHGFRVERAQFTDYNRDDVAAPGLLVTEALRGTIVDSQITEPANPAYSIRLARSGPRGRGVRSTLVQGNVLDLLHPISLTPEDGGYTDGTVTYVG